MKRDKLIKKNCIQKEYIDKTLLKKFSNNFNKIEKKTLLEIENSKKTLNILSKKYKFNFKIKDLNKFKKYKSIAIIGMGGSILGTESIYNFLDYKIRKKMFFFNNLNSKTISFFKKKEKIKNVLFIIVSKSGNTIETLSNFLSLEVINKNAKNIIIITEKKLSPLYQIAKKYNLFYVAHKKTVGGRYSILTEVGIIPAYLMGLNIVRLRKKISDYLNGKNKLFLKDSVVKLASLLKRKKLKSLVFLNYSPELEKFLYWCQQLIAESLGKKNNGFLPVVSPAPKDHHSMLQLYLDGPKDKLFYIFSDENKIKKKFYVKKVLDNKNYYDHKSLDEIKKAQKNSLIQAFKNKRLPYREFTVKEFSEEVLGELFSIFILETIIIGNLLNLNPYNQPAVEQVKISTKKLLS